MCNCGKTQPPPPPPPPTETAAKTQSFSFIPPSGRTQVFGSRLEAEAARIRAGGAGTIRRS
mgnify:CR=1 FL=1